MGFNQHNICWLPELRATFRLVQRDGKQAGQKGLTSGQRRICKAGSGRFDLALLGPCSLLCTLCFIHVLQQNLQRKCQHLNFWLPNISHCKPLLPASSHLPELKSHLLMYSRANILEGFCQNQFSSWRLELGKGGGLSHAMLILPRGSLRLSHFSLILIRNWKFGGLALAFSKLLNCGYRWDGGKSGIRPWDLNRSWKMKLVLCWTQLLPLMGQKYCLWGAETTKWWVSPWENE